MTPKFPQIDGARRPTTPASARAPVHEGRHWERLIGGVRPIWNELERLTSVRAMRAPRPPGATGQRRRRRGRRHSLREGSHLSQDQRRAREPGEAPPTTVAAAHTTPVRTPPPAPRPPPRRWP